jgi:hypothetical protein
VTKQHPIAPPPELVQKWMDDLYNAPGQFVSSDDKALSARAAQWGADQELEACCEALDMVNGSNYWSQVLRSGRRPKRPSLKEQALEALSRFDWNSHTTASEMDADLKTIHRALEALDD